MMTLRNTVLIIAGVLLMLASTIAQSAQTDNDVPDEAALTPALWGKIKFE